MFLFEADDDGDDIKWLQFSDSICKAIADWLAERELLGAKPKSRKVR